VSLQYVEGDSLVAHLLEKNERGPSPPRPAWIALLGLQCGFGGVAAGGPSWEAYLCPAREVFRRCATSIPCQLAVSHIQNLSRTFTYTLVRPDLVAARKCHAAVDAVDNAGVAAAVVPAVEGATLAGTDADG